jgi:serine/threonine-protein kinase
MVLMFTDVVNSTGLKRELGVDGYRPLVDRHDAIVRECLAACRSGRILQDTGDGYFLAFDTISDAVRAALLLQWRMAGERWPRPFTARVGMHAGEVGVFTSKATDQTRFMASAIDVAARVMSLALGGQILMTRAVFDEARQVVREHPASTDDESVRVNLAWAAHGPYLFKGTDEPTEVCEVGAAGAAPMSPPPNSEKAARHIRPGEEDTLGWRPAVGLAPPSAPHWVVVEKLGEGGFGEVWLARHTKTRATRVFKFCFDAERLRALKREVAFFRLLKETLGERRDIAAVKDWQFDAPPYFIETDYTPLGNLQQWAQGMGGIDQVPLDDRVRIVAEVAEALAAAHSVGILHKDVKPSNVLIAQDEGGGYYARLADFGIGVLTDRSRLEALNITADGITASNMTANDSSRTGTRMYSPPESLASQPHTVQGDIYAVGVILYQMIVGDLSRPLAVGWERDVQDESLRSDVAECVEGDVTRRLSTATELAARLRDFRGRTKRLIQARASAAAARRKVKYLRVGVGLSILFVTCFATFWLRDRFLLKKEAAQRERAEQAERSASTLLKQETAQRQRAEQAESAAGDLLKKESAQRQRAEEAEAAAIKGRTEAEAQRREAQRETRIARALNYVQEVAFREYSQGRFNASHVTAAAPLEKAAAEAERQFATEPDMLSAVYQVVGERYQGWGWLKEAAYFLEKARDLREAAHGSDDPEALMSVHFLALVRQGQGRGEEAEQLFKRVVAARRSVLGETHPETLVSVMRLGDLLAESGRQAEAEPHLLATLEIRSTLYRETLMWQGVRASEWVRPLAGSPAVQQRAASLYEKEYHQADALRRSGSVRDTRLISAAYLLASVSHQMKDDRTAEALLRELVKLTGDRKGERSPVALGVVEDLCELLDGAGRGAEAFTVFSDFVTQRSAALGPSDPATLYARHRALFRREARDTAGEALAERRDLVVTMRKTLGETHLYTLESLKALSEAQRRAGRRDEALRTIDEALALGGQSFAKESSIVADLMGSKGELLDVVVAKIQGKPQFRQSANSPWEQLAVGTRLSPDMFVRTGPKDSIMLQLIDGSSVGVGRLTVATVASAVKDRASVPLNTGSKLSMPSYISGGEGVDEGTIRSPNSTLVIRG